MKSTFITSNASDYNELGDLKKPGTIIWSYTGIAFMVTLGWKMRFYGKEKKVAVTNGKDVKWLRRKVIKKCRKYDRTIENWQDRFYDRWQITP